MQAKSLILPDERILDLAYRFAESVWHLKDRLKTWVEAKGLDCDIESIASSREELLVVADLANQKKHGALRQPRSGRSPRLGTPRRDDSGANVGAGSGVVSFDTSKSGPMVWFYSGSRKEKELLVTNPVPIPFTLEILVGDGETSLGNASEFIYSAFCRWLPIIKDAGILAGDRESEELRKDLGL